jgi:hypothetical protein
MNKHIARAVQLIMCVFVLLFFVRWTFAVFGLLCFALGGLIMWANDIDWTETEGKR